MSDETKAIVTVSEMARMCGLSRARFYQLQKAGVFPAPTYQEGRPVYTEEQQLVCLEVRKKNRGVNNKPVLFYARRIITTEPVKTVRLNKPSPQQKKDVTNLLDGLNASA